MNKEIKRDGDSIKIFDERSLGRDYKTLLPILKKGLHVLDVGCGTGAISKDIATYIGPTGFVTGIDNTGLFIERGRESYQSVPNLELIHADLFHYNPAEHFDLIISARTLQWLSNVAQALEVMKRWLQPGGMLSVLDYNHAALEWHPEPPQSMRQFYNVFLKWRADAGMNNRLAEDLPKLFKGAGLQDIEVLEANEVYKADNPHFKSRLGIWSKVAAMPQIVEEGYITDSQRRHAIAEYDDWIETKAELMVMKLNEVRGKIKG